MSSQQIRALAADFEIGGHTIDHRPLTRLSSDQARRQITDSRSWLEDVTGKPCRVFCPPLGRFGREHLDMIRTAGFIGMRSVEMLSIAAPCLRRGLAIIPTTIQAFDHGRLDYVRNVVRRLAIGNLWPQLLTRSASDWRCLAARLALLVQERGGVFHLWGHSWEVEERGQWKQLEQVLRALGSLAQTVRRASNAQLLDAH